MNKKRLSIILIFIILCLIRFWYMPFIFFIQDEWFVFGTFIDQGWKVILFGLDLPRFGHFAPISKLIAYLIYLLYGLNPLPYNIVSITIHILNTYLVYRISKKIISGSFVHLIPPAFFLSSSIGYEQILWPMVGINSLSLTFSLIAWDIALNLNAELNQNLKFFLSGLLILVASLVVENALPMFLFIPLVIIVKYHPSIIKRIKILLPFFMIFFSYLIFRAVFIWYNIGSNTQIQAFSSSLFNYKKIIILPFMYLSQSFLSQGFWLTLSNKLAQLRYSSPDQIKVYAENVLFKRVTALGGLVFFLIILSSIIYAKYIKKKSFTQPILLSTVFIFFCSLVFIFVPGAANNFSIFPQRYLYFGLAGSSLIIGLLAGLLLNFKQALLRSFVIILMVVLVSWGEWQNYSLNSQFFNTSKKRENILYNIKKDLGKLPLKTVVYTESDSPFYGLPEEARILPFQSGLGQTLLVWLQDKEKFPQKFFQNRFLWELTDQGYKEEDGRSFGYFYKFKDLINNFGQYNLAVESIKAFSYDSTTGQLVNITDEVKGRIIGYLTKKELINPTEYTVVASQNNQDISFVSDNDRATYWSSKLAYEHPQYIDVDLKKNTKVAGIVIDSFQNKNQNQVGYQILLSVDGNNWTTVFTSKRWPPDKNGYSYIYFLPSNARLIRIRQIGFHHYSSWVISELNILKVADSI